MKAECPRFRFEVLQAALVLVNELAQVGALGGQTGHVNILRLCDSSWQAAGVRRQEPVPQACVALRPRHPTAHSYVNANTVSASHLRNDSLSLNCLNSSVSSCIRLTITRHSALSCSMRAFCRSEWARALL